MPYLVLFRKTRQKIILCVLVVLLLSLTLRRSYNLQRSYNVRRPMPTAWRSIELEAGLLRVMEYIEKERKVDSVVRDAFVDRIWRSVKVDLVNQIITKRVAEKEFDYETFFRQNIDLLNISYPSPITRDEIKENRMAESVSGRRFYRPRLINGEGEESNPKPKVDFDEFLSKPILNQFEFTFNYDLSSACSKHPIDTLIAVPSAPGNFERREKVRLSARALFAKDPQNRAKLLFFMGSLAPMVTGYLFNKDNNSNSYTSATQDKINLEQIIHGDIVQATYIDSYKNITRKAALLLYWGSKFCTQAKYLIRTDDDLMKVDIKKLISAMYQRSVTNEHFILGTKRVGWSIVRDPYSEYAKYFVSYEDGPYENLPPFLLGGVMGYPIRTAGLLLEAMRRVVLFWLDDVFLTGMCAKRVGVPIFHHPDFVFQHD